MAFDAGALVYKIQALGAQQAQQDLKALDATFRRTGQGAAESKTKVDSLGKTTDDTAKKAKDAKRPLEEQAKATEDVGKKSEEAAEDQEKQKKASEGQLQAAKALSVALLAVGAATGAMVAMAVVRHTEFDQAMSNVRAATMASAEAQEELSESALQAGADTAYSATEAAAAQEELAKAGLSVTDIINGGLNGALALAAAGQLAVARSAEIMATTLKQYKLEAEDAAHVSDLLAAGAGKAQGSVDDLALALQYVGPVAAGLGLSIEETTGALAFFAEQGQLGERAGTGLRGVLMSLTSPSSIAGKTMEKYGIEIFNANGSMKSLAQVAEQLRNAFGDLTEAERAEALGRIFGNAQITAARVLYDGGAKAVEDWTEKVNDSGYAAEQAAIRQDNLAGDIEKLGGAWETALIRTGSGANDTLREMTQILTALVDVYGEMPGEVQQGVLVFGSLAAAVLIASGATVGLRAKFIELSAQMERTNISLGKTALLGAGVGLALAGVLTAVVVLAQKQAEARQRAEAYNTALKQGADAAREFVAESLTAEKSHLWISRGSAADAAEKFGISLETVADAAEGNKDALAEMSDVIKAGQGDVEAAGRLMDEYGLTFVEVSRASTLVAEGIDDVSRAREDAAHLERQQNELTGEGVEVTKTAAEAYMDAAGSVDELNRQLSDLIDQINEANGVGQDAVTANARWLSSLDGIGLEVQAMKDDFERANGSLDGFSLSLDQNTVSGSKNAAMLAGVAADAQKAAEAQFYVDQQTMSGTEAAEKYAETLAAQRQAFVDSATAAGFNADEVNALADQIFQLPSEKEIDIIANTVPAREAINGVITDYEGRAITLRVGAQGQQTYTRDGRTFYEKDGGVVEYYGNGGTREHHVAQIARAGAWRVWAEDETGGEAYIPLSPGKRDRSTAILGEVAGRFGYHLVPAGATFHASGSLTPAAVHPVSDPQVQATFVMPAGVNEQELVRAAMSDLAELLRGE